MAEDYYADVLADLNRAEQSSLHIAIPYILEKRWEDGSVLAPPGYEFCSEDEAEYWTYGCQAVWVQALFHYRRPTGDPAERYIRKINPKLPPGASGKR